jgi:hypothetical protein
VRPANCLLRKSRRMTLERHGHMPASNSKLGAVIFLRPFSISASLISSALTIVLACGCSSPSGTLRPDADLDAIPEGEGTLDAREDGQRLDGAIAQPDVMSDASGADASWLDADLDATPEGGGTLDAQESEQGLEGAIAQPDAMSDAGGVDASLDSSNVGVVGSLCSAPGCGTGETSCDGLCVSVQDPRQGCGSCQACALPHAQATLHRAFMRRRRMRSGLGRLQWQSVGWLRNGLVGSLCLPSVRDALHSAE